MSILDQIKQKLAAALNIDSIKIIDDSDNHSEHGAFSRPSHVKLLIISNSFLNKSLLERNRMVNAAIKDEIADIHSISLKLMTTEESERGD